MTRCCGGIPSDNPDITESRVPYMFRDCLSESEWSKTSCDNHCCDKGTPEKGTCIPTNEGGYCKYQDEYWRYNSSKEKERLSQDDAERLTKYKRGISYIDNVEDLSFDKYYRKRLYDNTQKKVLLDLQNKRMEERIKNKANWSQYDRTGKSYDNPTEKSEPRALFESSLGLPIGFVIFVILLITLFVLIRKLA